MDRKQFLKYVTQGGSIALAMPSLLYCNSDVQSKSLNAKATANFNPDIDIELTSNTGSVNILPGSSSDIYRYETNIIKARSDAIKQLKDSYLGPVMKVKKGDKIRVRYKNQLPQESIIHWHGLHIPPEMDGHPMYAINNGEEFVYEFTITNPPGTYWFHPHPDKITGPQVYNGLAGMFIVEDDTDTLPGGEYDIPLIIQDRTFDSNNQLEYLSNNRMSQMQGFLGDDILINGKISEQQEVDRTAYRFRVLNGSNARIYKLGWSDQSPLTIVGTDGGLLSHPVKKPYLMLAPGERVEIWKDFSSHDANEQVVLKSLAFEDGTTMGMNGMGGMGGMMGNMGMQSAANPNGHPYNLMRFKINNTSPEPKSLPEKLSNIAYNNISEATNTRDPRKFHFSNNHMQWVINGETFQMHEVAEWEQVQEGTKEIWEFINGNDGSGMGMMQNMMQMPHPVHIHGFSFQIIERDTGEVDANVWNTVKDGFVDEGWQDTFLLLPGMKVKILISFEDFTGKYIYHCHNLEHEDMGMMRNFEII